MGTVREGEGKLKRLIVFDVEGVLLPKRRYLLFEVARKLSFLGFVKIIIIGFLYEIGFSSLGFTLRRIFKILRGLAIGDLFELHKRIPLMPGVEEVFRELNKLGYRTALISSGLPTVLVEDLAARLKADYAFGLKLDLTNDCLTGEIAGDVLKSKGKALVLKRILKEGDLSPKDCVVVADDRNNLPMFSLCGLGIGYNPDFVLSAKSDFVITGELTEILPFITEDVLQASSLTLSRSDIVRETIHIGGFLVPFVCQYFLNTLWMSLLIFIITLLYVASELGRLEGINFPIFSEITWKAVTKRELHEFTSAPIFFALGMMLSLTIFPVPISYASIAVLTLGDGFATVFGKVSGRTVLPFNKGKRLEATIFGLLFAFVGATLFVNPVKASIAALVGMFTECLPLPVSDNISVPMVSGLALIAMS